MAKLDYSKEIIEVDNKNFKFSVAGASSDMVGLLVPAENRESPYLWDKVPNNDSYIQMLRACNYYTDNYWGDAVTADRWWCWDKDEKMLIHHAAADDFKKIVKIHPDWIWLIGNEPDHKEQDNLTPQEYAEFFGWIAKTITNQLRLKDRKAYPKIVLYQTTVNPNYCEAVYLHLKKLVTTGYWSDWPQDLEAKDAIWAISIHKYIDSISTLEEDILPSAINKWKKAMNNFAYWANTVDGGALADKPLWITEFGSLKAFCTQKLKFRFQIDQKGGIGCIDEATRGNGKTEDDYVFYGRNNREGIWGLQKEFVKFFINRENDAYDNQGDWEAAWWFISEMGDWNMDGECDTTIWLFGDNTFCNQNRDSIGRAGETYHNTINCFVEGKDCPKSYHLK